MFEPKGKFAGDIKIGTLKLIYGSRSSKVKQFGDLKAQRFKLRNSEL